MTLLAFCLGTLLGWCAHIVYSDLRRQRRDRETTLAVAAFFQAEERVCSGVREMQRNG